MIISHKSNLLFNVSLIFSVVSVLTLIVSLFVWTDVLPLVSYLFLLVTFILLALSNVLRGL